MASGARDIWLRGVLFLSPLAKRLGLRGEEPWVGVSNGEWAKGCAGVSLLWVARGINLWAESRKASRKSQNFASCGR